jgi:hypothetical protein
MSVHLDQLCINTIRTLSMDAVQEANSGHPGTPMAVAPTGYTLWQRHLRFDPADPIWPTNSPRVGPGPGRLRARRLAGRRAGRDSHGDRERGVPVRLRA